MAKYLQFSLYSHFEVKFTSPKIHSYKQGESPLHNRQERRGCVQFLRSNDNILNLNCIDKLSSNLQYIGPGEMAMVMLSLATSSLVFKLSASPPIHLWTMLWSVPDLGWVFASVDNRDNYLWNVGKKSDSRENI